MLTVNKHSKVSLQETYFFFTISLKGVFTSIKSLEKVKKNIESYIYIVEAFQKYDI